jgi:hypothetical protein
LADNFENILDVKPRIFDTKDGRCIDEIGYIAEELDDEGLDHLVVYNADGKPDAVKYDRIALYAIEIIKAQEKRIRNLEREIEKLKRRK